jgi:RHS repeat-associated protein
VARYAQSLGIDEPLAMYRSGVGYAYHADGLGSIGGLTDATGNIAATYTYDSFGNLTGSTGTVTNPYRYTAREFDTETGIYYYRARYYFQGIGRFASEDPIAFQGRDVNFYRYVRANPGNFGDPFGLVAVDKNFPSACLPSLQRALNLVRRAATRDPRCNCLFTNIGDRRSLKELVDDPRISIQYDPVQEYTEGGATIAYTSAGDKSNIYIDPLGCRLGRWALASALVHELTHITLTPAPGQEELAQSVQLYCGFKVYVTARPTVITVRP